MNTRIIKFIQFFNYTETRYDADPELYRMYPIGSETVDVEFYETREDDDGDEYEAEIYYDCVSFYYTIDDYYKDHDIEFIKSRGLKYTIIELEVNCDENDKPIWNVA